MVSDDLAETRRRHSGAYRLIMKLTPQTPRSTLFPYTTLFRSSEQIGGQMKVFTQTLFRHEFITLDGLRLQMETIKDRKSTRLNSSHITISYAVFCLKEKTLRVREGTPDVVIITAVNARHYCRP